MKKVFYTTVLLLIFFLVSCDPIIIGDVLPSSPELDEAFLSLVRGKSAQGVVMGSPAPAHWSENGKTFVLTVQPPFGIASIKTSYTFIKALNYTSAVYNDGKENVSITVRGNTVTIPSGMGTMKLTFN